MKDLEGDVIDRVKFSSPSWDNKGEGFFYSRYDDAKSAEGTSTQKVSSNRVYYHKVGTKQSEDSLIYERPDEPDFSYSVFMTDDSRFLILITKRSTEEVNLKHFVDLHEAVITDFN
jgi:prolyl oligopeptidase